MQRSMEILRGAGIEEQVREGSHPQFEPDGAIMSVETLAGRSSPGTSPTSTRACAT
jgi:hypothetical protein